VQFLSIRDGSISSRTKDDKGNGKEIEISDFKTQTLYREVDILAREYKLDMPEGIKLGVGDIIVARLYADNKDNAEILGEISTVK